MKNSGPLISVVLLMIFLGIMSYNNNKVVFWSVNIVNILTIGIAIYLSYYMSLKNSVLNRQKFRFEAICERITVITARLCSIEITDDISKNQYLMSLRSLDNRMRLLHKFDKILEYKNIDIKTENNLCNDIIYLEKQYTDLSEFIGNHITDYSFLQRSKVDLEKFLENINGTIDKILVYLEI